MTFCLSCVSVVVCVCAHDHLLVLFYFLSVCMKCIHLCVCVSVVCPRLVPVNPPCPPTLTLTQRPRRRV